MTREELGIGRTSSTRLAEHRLRNSQNGGRQSRFARLSSVMGGNGITPAALDRVETSPKAEASRAAQPKAEVSRTPAAASSPYTHTRGDVDRAVAKALETERARMFDVLTSPAAQGKQSACAFHLASPKGWSAQTIIQGLAGHPTDQEQERRRKANASTSSAAVWDRAIANMQGKPAALASDPKSADVWARAIDSIYGKQGKEA